MEIIQCVQNDNVANVKDTIYAIKNAGFDGVFVQWYNKDWEILQQEQVDLCKKLGLKILFAHLGYSNINQIWDSGEFGDKLIEDYKKDILDCKKNGINLVVMHLASKAGPQVIDEIGLNRIKKIVAFAEELNIKIAFENTRIYNVLEYVFNNIKSDIIGLCLDSGHLHCHFKDVFDWKKFKNKIFAIHFHDNIGQQDEHLLPFDGTINWDWLMGCLKDANYKGPVTLESCYRNDYLNMSLEQFYNESYKRAQKIKFLKI